MTNPTTMHDNETKFKDLCCDVCFVSETSTTLKMQKYLAPKYKKQNLQVAWGGAAPPQRICIDGQPSIRGMSVGVAIISKTGFAIRPTREEIPGCWNDTCRIVVSFLHLSTITIRLIGVYGVQCSAYQSKQKNLSLWQFILHLLSSHDMPTLIGGDMNIRPQDLATWPDIRALGYHETFEMYEQREGKQLPCTCKGATRNDTLVFSRHFAASFSDAYVSQSMHFPQHDPLIVHFRLKMVDFVYRSLQMPDPLQEDVLNCELFQKLQQKKFLNHSDNMCPPSCSHEKVTEKLHYIGKTFENAYLQTCDYINRCSADGCEVEIPKKSKMNRLCPRRPVVKPPPSTVRKARHGCYEPPAECFGRVTIHWIKQLRRIEALMTRLKKGNWHTPDVVRQNEREWVAIRQATGFKKSFQKFVFDELHLSVWYCNCPDFEWLKTVFDLFKPLVDQAVRKEKDHRNKCFRYRLDIDKLTFGGSLVHALVKNPKPPMVDSFKTVVHHDATIIRTRKKDKPRLRIHDAFQLQPNQNYSIASTEETIKVVDIVDEQCVVVEKLPKNIPGQFQVKQEKFSADPEVISRTFFEYWAPYWLREKQWEVDSLEPWKKFLDLIQYVPDLPKPCNQSEHSIEEWYHAIKQTKPNTSRGICGFSQPEVAAMHPCLIQSLIQSFHVSSPIGLPDWMMIARVVLIPKFVGASQICDLRPITVYSLLFRIWSKVCARRLLTSWKYQMPRSIVGAMPGRSCSQLTLKWAMHIEHHLMIHSDLGGFVLDISKCFNAVGRKPAMKLMLKHGFDQHCHDLWFNSMKNMSRTVQILQNYSSPEYSTTGIAEGDPLSVCCMLLIGYSWHSIIAHLDINTAVYVDDWQWSGHCPEDHIQAMILTESFLSSLRLSSDPRKSWVWGTSHKARKMWHQVSEVVTGSPMAWKLSFIEKELGTMLHYSKHNLLGFQKDRLQQGFERLARLKSLPLGSVAKAEIVQTNIWPATLFGSESTYIGKRHIDQLRSAMVDAVMTKTQFTCCSIVSGLFHYKVDDPLIFLIGNTLRMWRQLLITEPDEVASFMFAFANPHEKKGHAFGPVTALHNYLGHVAWILNADG